VLPTVARRAEVSETSIELPCRLEISPNRYAQWAHALRPVKGSDNRYELWHSRLATRGSDGKPYEGPSYLRAIRALWTRDAHMNAANGSNWYSAAADAPFDASLMPMDRIRIVHQSSNFTLLDGDGHTIKPAAVPVNRLMLTALGGFMDVRGDWGDNPEYDLSVWEHRAALGRDHYVKIVETGHLYPFGHRTVKVTITERKLTHDRPHLAVLYKREFLVVKQPVQEYTAGRDTPTVQGPLRKMPFTKIHIKTLVTPPLKHVTEPDPRIFHAYTADNKPFRFACEGLDPEGRWITFSAPVVWVAGNLNDHVDSTRFTEAQAAYATYGDARKCDLLGQRVAFAESNKADDTTFETHSITFTADRLDWSLAKPLGYYSTFLTEIAETELAIEAARQLAGAGETTAFAYHPSFVTNGFGAGNSGEVIFGLSGSAAPIKMDFSQGSDKSGGFITPNLQISGLSRKLGPAAGSLDHLASGTFDPADVFGALNAKLFGVIDLFSIIDGLAGGLDKAAPKFITQALDVVEGLIQDATALMKDVKAALGDGAAVVNAITKLLGDIAPDAAKLAALPADFVAAVTALSNLAADLASATMNQGLKQDILRRAEQLKATLDSLDLTKNPNPITQFLDAAEMAKDLRVHLEWRPTIKAFPAGDPLFEPNDEDNGLILSADMRAKDLPGKPAGVDLVASLEKFNVYLMGKSAAFITIPFKHIRFSMLAGKKPDVDVVFDQLEWGGVLAFVKTLMDIIPSSGFSDPPALTVDETGISASFSVSLPNLGIGVFSLQNITLGAGFKVPFIGDPMSISFNFCTRENPFILTVMMIGGGGFFGITLDPSGVKILEAQFEAGASLSLDFGVASGSVSVMVGVYFKMEGSDVTLMAFLKIHGEVEVLGGIISASLTLELDLTYESATGKLVGTASMEIEVHVLFFSVSVTVSYSKKLAGSNGDPTFADGMRPSLPSEPAYAPWDEYVNAFAA
jgi:hypothetical protein